MTNVLTRRDFSFVAASTLLLNGCGGGDDAFPSVTDAKIQDLGPISRRIAVTLSEAAAIEVEYWTLGSPRLRMIGNVTGTPSQVVDLPRLRAQSTYSVEIRTRVGVHRSPVRWSGTLQTGTLPNDLRAISFAVLGQPSVPLTFVSLRSAFTGGVIFDPDGQVVWYGRTNIAPQGATQRRNGNWVIELNGVGLAEFSAIGEQIALLPQSRLPAGYQIHHGVTSTPKDTLLFLAFEPRTIRGITLAGESVWEWDPAKDELVKRWSAFDFLDPATDFGSRSVASDWFHANSIAVGKHDNIIVSFHFLDQIISIAPDFSALEWRLGGPSSTFALTPEQLTSGQHSAREVAPDAILLFDNGFARVGGERYSRALELKLDGAARRATTVWQYRPGPDIWANVISSVRRLGNGNSVLTFGTQAVPGGATGPLAIHEVTPDGTVARRVTIGLAGAGTVFQGDPLTTIGGETELA